MTDIATLQNQNVQRAETPRLITMLAAPSMKKKLEAAAGNLMNPDRMLALVARSVRSTPRLLQCSPESVIGAMLASASLGLEPNTPQQQAFLIPYKARKQIDGQWQDVYECQFQIGARGYITLAYRSGYVESIQASAIHEHDVFEHMMGSESFLKFAKTLRDPGQIIGAFCFTRLKGGGEAATVLPIAEIYKARDRSETFKALVRGVQEAKNDKDRAKAQAKLDETPWVMFEDDMATKTVIKKHAKQLPIQAGDRLAAAVAMDENRNIAAFSDVDVLRTTIETGMEPEDIPTTQDTDLQDQPAQLDAPRAPAVEIPADQHQQGELIQQGEPRATQQQRRSFGAE